MKKFFSYIFTFILLFVISAVSTVSLSYFGKESGTANPSVNVEGQGTSSSLFTGIIGTFDKEKKFSVNGSIEIEFNEQIIPVALYVNVDIEDKDNIKIEGYASIEIDQAKLVVEFAYYNNIIYLSYRDVNIKASIDSIKDLIEEIKNTIPLEGESGDTEQEATDQGSVLDQYLPKIMAALDSMQEESMENGDKEITLSIDGLAFVKAVTSVDNIPKKVLLQTEEISGIKIKADLKLEFNSNIVVVNPEGESCQKEYVDINQLIAIVKDTLKIDNVNLNAEIVIDDKIEVNKVSAQILTNISNNNYKLTLKENTFGFINNASVVYYQGNLFVEANNINVLASEKLLNKAPGLIEVLINNY